MARRRVSLLARGLGARRGQAPGFRMDRVDGLFIGVLIALCGLLQGFTGVVELALIPLYLGLTFFLFCNVFRIGNTLESLWYVPFTVIAAWCLNSLDLAMFWWLVALVLEPWKWALVGYRIVKGPYVGILSRR